MLDARCLMSDGSLIRVVLEQFSGCQFNPNRQTGSFTCGPSSILPFTVLVRFSSTAPERGRKGEADGADCVGSFCSLHAGPFDPRNHGPVTSSPWTINARDSVALLPHLLTYCTANSFFSLAFSLPCILHSFKIRGTLGMIHGENRPKLQPQNVRDYVHLIVSLQFSSVKKSTTDCLCFNHHIFLCSKIHGNCWLAASLLFTFLATSSTKSPVTYFWFDCSICSGQMNING